MNKKEFAEILLRNNIKFVTITSDCDGNGGYYPVVIFNNSNLKTSDSFEHVEFEGDASKALAHRNDVFIEHTEVRYDPPRDEYTMQKLVISALETLQEEGVSINRHVGVAALRYIRNTY